MWFYLFLFLITTLLHQLISHNISFVLGGLSWARHLRSPNKHVISHLIPAQRSFDRIADQTWWLIYRGYQTEWGAEFGKHSPSSQCSFLNRSLTALSHGLPPTPTGLALTITCSSGSSSITSTKVLPQVLTSSVMSTFYVHELCSGTESSGCGWWLALGEALTFPSSAPNQAVSSPGILLECRLQPMPWVVIILLLNLNRALACFFSFLVVAVLL